MGLVTEHAPGMKRKGKEKKKREKERNKREMKPKTREKRLYETLAHASAWL